MRESDYPSIFEPLYTTLKELGVQQGDAVLVHTGFKAFGLSGSGSRRIQLAHEFWQGIQTYLGAEGTLLVPALSFDFVGEHNPVFHELATESCVGFLAELFRREYSQARSLNATHSVCGWGAHLDYYLGDHQKDSTPLGANSPYARLNEPRASQKSWIVFLGCSPRANTSMHGVEELVEPDYLFDGSIQSILVDKHDRVFHVSLRVHGFRGVLQRYDRLIEILPQKAYRSAKLFKADCWSLSTNSVWKYGYRELQKNQHAFIDFL